MDKVDKYINQQTWLVKENANSSYSFSGLMAFLGEEAIKEHMLTEVYSKEIAKAHKEGKIHIHDLGHGVIGYCAGWSLGQLLEEGFNGVRDKVQSAPPKHFRTALGQMVNFLGTLQMEFAGAQAFSSFDTYLAPFVAKDKLTYKEVKQGMQEFIFNLNVPARWGGQAPFTNITLDWVVPEDMANKHPKIGGEEIEETYADFQKEMDMINKAYIEVMIEGDTNGRIFSFPIPTYNITKDFVWDSENAKLLFEMTAKYGTPYFQNFINSTIKPGDVRSMCMPGSTEIIYKNSNGDIAKNEIRHLVDNMLEKNIQYEILVNGKFEKTKNAIKLKYDDDLIEIELENGIIQRFTKDHPCVVNGKNEIVNAENLKKGDEIPLRKDVYNTELDSADHGRIIGLYLGDGWIKQKVTTVFSFGKHEKHLIDFVKDFAEKNFLADVFIKEYETYWNVFVKSKGFTNFIKDYVNEGDCYTKRILPSIYNRGYNFRKNVLIGMIESDGYFKKSKTVGKSRLEIHIINKKLLQDLQSLGYTVEQDTKLSSKNNKTGEKRKISYVLSFKDGSIRQHFENEYLIPNTNDKYFYSKIKSITKRKFKGFVYDFEMDNNEHLFSLLNGIITHNCCRLQLDLAELRMRGNGLFGAGEQTGSIGVVTINLPRLAYEAKKSLGRAKLENLEEEFRKGIKKYMNIAKESLEIKRKIIDENLKRGLMPYTQRYLGTWDNHFSTIGLIGMNEATLNLIGEDITTKEGHALAERTLEFMRDILVEFQEETGNLYNLEATPAEGTTYRLAQIDRDACEGIIQQGEGDSVYYTNSSQLPVDYTNNIFKAIKNQDPLQTKYTGGTVLHIFLGERVTDWINTMLLVKKIANNTRMPYFTITPTFSICPVHGYISGEHEFCPLEHSKEQLQKYGVIVENDN